MQTASTATTIRRSCGCTLMAVCTRASRQWLIATRSTPPSECTARGTPASVRIRIFSSSFSENQMHAVTRTSACALPAHSIDSMHIYSYMYNIDSRAFCITAYPNYCSENLPTPSGADPLPAKVINTKLDEGNQFNCSFGYVPIPSYNTAGSPVVTCQAFNVTIGQWSAPVGSCTRARRCLYLVHCRVHWPAMHWT